MSLGPEWWLRLAVAATQSRLTALTEAEDAQEARHAAWRHMHTSGMSYRAISEAMRVELTARGLDEAEIRRAGVSHYNIGLALRS